ncbi:hypothetical protein cand_014420 [Cryptosporidium andersoni]|uniref:Uncharacterized protein n=1 Tax=Cryptosporidium andersoni TaxID=117008 RepID=A0A1J4MTQ5_9CRYT|nr:hypothetical protein cand_014420 [Cryptosporidium andersoni]
MGSKQSIPTTNDGYLLRIPKFQNFPEDIKTNVELEEGVIVLMIAKSGSTSFMEIDTDDGRFAIAKAEADRIAEEEALRLSTEQSIRVNEGDGVYSVPSSRVITNVASFISHSSSQLESEVTSAHSDTINNTTDDVLDTEDNKLTNGGFIGNLASQCGAVFSECHQYPKFRIVANGNEVQRRIDNVLHSSACDTEFVIDKTTATCGCLGPKHDRLTCKVCRGMHLEDAPLLY